MLRPDEFTHFVFTVNLLRFARQVIFKEPFKIGF